MNQNFSKELNVCANRYRFHSIFLSIQGLIAEFIYLKEKLGGNQCSRVLMNLGKLIIRRRCVAASIHFSPSAQTLKSGSPAFFSVLRGWSRQPPDHAKIMCLLILENWENSSKHHWRQSLSLPGTVPLDKLDRTQEQHTRKSLRFRFRCPRSRCYPRD